MSKETENTNRIAEIEAYIRDLYPVKQNEVQEVIKDAESHSKKNGEEVFQTVTSLLESATKIAKKVGSTRRAEDVKPQDYLPNVIEAAKKLEELEDIREKRLTLPVEVSFYITAELTRAHKLSGMQIFDYAGLEAKRAIKMIELYDELKQMPDIIYRRR